jgi:hypothetical protein
MGHEVTVKTTMMFARLGPSSATDREGEEMNGKASWRSVSRMRSVSRNPA